MNDESQSDRKITEMKWDWEFDWSGMPAEAFYRSNRLRDNIINAVEKGREIVEEDGKIYFKQKDEENEKV